MVFVWDFSSAFIFPFFLITVCFNPFKASDFVVCGMKHTHVAILPQS